MKRRLSTVMLSTAFAVYIGIAAGCGGGGGDSATAAAAPTAQKPSTSAKGNNGNAVGKRRGNISSGGQLHVDGASASVEKGGVYIVMMKDDPTVMAEAEGRKGKYNPNSAAAKRYADGLALKQDRALAKVGGAGKKLYSYVHSFNGFAAELSAAQAVALSKNPDVARIWNDEFRQLHTNYSPEFLGLDAANGPWDSGVTGEDVIIGVIDSGIWPDGPSFSDAGDTPYNSYGPPPSGWRGTCESGEQWSQQDCNNKLIGARYFVGGWGASPRGKARNGVVPQGYNSARDDDGVGHGSHTTSTAGGNRDVTMTLAGEPVLGDSQGSGVAPRARLAHYKACWNDEGCTTSDLVAAIDAAVADGVDVINYSIGSASTNIFAADDVAFLFAEAAGVYVATSNGNDGPAPGTTGSPAGDPWVISVGAATRDGVQTTLGARINSPESVAGDYSALEGAITKPLSVTGPVTADVAAADPILACEPLTSDLSGHIALIERGACTFTAKVTNAVNAGAIGILMFTDDRPKTSMGGDATSTTKRVPGVMIDRDPGLAIQAALDDGPVNATLSPTIFLPVDDVGNVMADFSSRGPNLGAINIIKPDVTAPGVNILAATTPTPLPEGVHQDTGQIFRYVSGTSMSSPHVAGTLALVKQAHPDWTPSMAKSAVMTSARQNVVKEDGSTPADAFDMGSGYIQPGNALDPGLVYDVDTIGYGSIFAYGAYICSVNPNFWVPGLCEGLFAALGYDIEDPTQLNYPSIGVATMVGTKTVNRTVTSVTPGTVEYCATIDAPSGVDASVDQECFEISEGESHTYALTLSATDQVETGVALFGSITWSDGSHEVFSPIVVRAVGISAPPEVFGTGTEGQITFDIEFGFAGEYTAGVHGLNPATEIEDSVADDPNNSYDPFSGVGITQYLWGYPEGTAFSRWQLRNDYTDGNDDLDLYVWACDAITFGCSMAGSSAGGTSDETVNLLLPEAFNGFGNPGTFYAIEVHGWQTDGPDANYTLFEWEFGLDDDAGNMTVDPTTVDAALGNTQTLTVDYSGLDAGAKYLGAISHSSPGGLEGLTLVSVE